MEFKVYGHGGVPVLALPARGGCFYETGRTTMPTKVGPSAVIEGKTSSSCGTASTARCLGKQTPRRRAEMQEK